MQTALDRHIEQTEGTRGGRPRIAGTRITVADLIIMHLRLGQTLEEIAATYQIDLAAAHAAMAYYYDHRPEVDQTIAEDREFAKAFRKSNPSALRSKLQAIRRG